MSSPSVPSLSEVQHDRPAAAPGPGETLRRQVPYYLTVLRRTWRASIFSYAVLPVLMLASFGLGLGSFVTAGGSSALGGISYLDFIAPGILATSALTAAAGESLYPVYASFKWTKMAYAMSSTPLRPGDVASGAVGYGTFRVVLAVVPLAVVLAAFGTLSSIAGAFVVVAAGVLTGAAHAAVFVAYAARARTDGALTLMYRLGVIPMTMFSGAFFPIDQLPEAVQWFAYVLPAWHGVELARMATTGTYAAMAGVHVVVLVAVGVAGWWLARRAYAQKLASQ